MNEVEKIKIMIEQIGSQGYRDGSSTKKGWIYHPIPFDEFNPPTHKASTIDEFACIQKDYGSFSDKRVLDIGCANGYFSFNIAMDGAASVVGYESDGFVHNVNEAIRKYKQIDNLQFINKHFGINDVDGLQDGELDVVIMLNIHMWIHKQTGAGRTKDLMKMLCKKSKVLYFQTAHKGGGGGYQVPEFTKAKHIKAYLFDAGFKSVECINQNMNWFKRFMFRCSNV